MKVLIVDDEKFVRQAIRIMLEKENIGISHMYEAANGVEAIEKIKLEKPQIIFTDMRMPMKDGKELLSWIKENYQGAKTIVISGYDDFEYMRHALTHGGVDYILKPIDSEQLIKATQKAAAQYNKEAQLRRQRAMKNITLNTMKPTYLQHIFSDFMFGKMFDSTQKKYVYNIFPTFQTSTMIQVAIIDIYNAPLNDKFIASKELLAFSVANICNEIIDKSQNGYTFVNSKTNEMIVMFWDKFTIVPNQINQLWQALYDTIGSAFHIGYGASSLPQNKSLISYYDAKDALAQCQPLKENEYIYENHTQYQNNTIIRIKKYIDDHYAEDLNMNNLAEKFFVSKEHISRRFKKETGENISKYITKVRIKKAKILLKNKDITIKKVSELVGYNDEKYFYQVFKQLNGVSANEYRNL